MNNPGEDELKPLAGLRLLLVEDEILIAMEMEDLIRGLGAEVAGPFSRVRDALNAVIRGPLNGAVLDIHLDGDTTFPVVDVLLARAIPVLFVTGDADDSLPSKYQALPRLNKPLEHAEFSRLATMIFNS
jgi:CheY-like chemotaxis protein